VTDLKEEPTLEELRIQIDETDRAIIEMFERRMHLARLVAKAKALEGKPVFDPERESAVLMDRVSRLKTPDFAPQIQRLFSLLMEMSRELQQQELSNLK
jgi:chorismate mutase/prephenate dehydratase